MPWIYPSRTRSLWDLLPPEFIDHWQNLVLATRQGDPFSCGPIWNMAYHATFKPEAPIFYATSSKCAIIFARRQTARGYDLLPIDDGWLFGQPLLGNQAPILLLDQLAEVAAEANALPGEIWISGISRPSLLARIIYETYEGFYDIYALCPWQNASASLINGVDGWLANRSANCRAKLHKASRKARDAGIEFERVTPDPANVSAIYGRMMAIEAHSWKGLNGMGITHSPEKEYYERMLEYLARRGEARIIFARFGDKDAGFIFGSLLGDIYRGQQFSYIQELAPFSIGNLMQYEKVKWLVESGIRRYDLGSATGPKMDYKKHWAEEFQDMATWIIRDRRLRQCNNG